jgi:hypothetical protein
MGGVSSAFDALLEELTSELQRMYEQLLRREDGDSSAAAEASGPSQEAIQREVGDLSSVPFP